jgi:3-hydroxyacyl-CoA dehydrogenase
VTTTAAARPVERVCVVGAGTMGAGIAVSLATAGYDVMLVDARPEQLAAGLATVKSTIEAAAAREKLSTDAAAVAIKHVTAADLGAARDVDLVIEAVFESLDVKREVFRRLGALCRAGAVLATNTSTLDVDAIAAETPRPADVVGMHFFSPAHVMKLVEIVRGRATAPDTIATALEVTRQLGKLGVVVGNCFGFVGNRMLYCYGRENQLMLLEGVPPMRIDRVLREFGMAMGPNAVGDLAGLDVGYRVRRERRDGPDDPRYYRVADLLVEAGRLGQKNGKGMFRYEPGSREPLEDPEVNAMIAAEASRLGVPWREVGDAEIVERCICALVNEGARILQEGIAATPGDIDAIWCNGYGFPRARGGPMAYADSLGLDRVLEVVKRYEREFGPRYWQPAPLLTALGTEKRTFSTWQSRKGDRSIF